MGPLLLGIVAGLAYANGSNDNFKGVATLRGSRLAGYRTAIVWGTLFTVLGAIASAWLSQGLLTVFTGGGLVPAGLARSPEFLVAVAAGATMPVLIASRIGMPISTTHALVGALVGCGVFAAGIQGVNLVVLTRVFVLPLLFSPLLSLGLTLALFPFVLILTRRVPDCLCVEEAVAVKGGPASVMAAAVPAGASLPSIVIGTSSECAGRPALARISLLDGLHWGSAALMSFARGLNDTPKIAALVLAGTAAPQTGVALLAGVMALGGLAGAARVAETMAERITPMDPMQGLSANLITAVLVGLASILSLPVSTTHVSCGSLFGIGWLRRGEADWRAVRQILLAWVVTLPVAAAAGAVCLWCLTAAPH